MDVVELVAFYLFHTNILYGIIQNLCLNNADFCIIRVSPFSAVQFSFTNWLRASDYTLIRLIALANSLSFAFVDIWRWMQISVTFRPM